MMANENAVTNLFLEMWGAWESTVPRLLLHENPKVLLRFLELCASPEGTFQQELNRKLGVNQSRLSKLTRKLVAAKLIIVHKPKDDQRKRLAVTTTAGKKMLRDFRARLGKLTSAPAFPRAKVSRKGIRPVAGQGSFDLDKYL